MTLRGTGQEGEHIGAHPRRAHLRRHAIEDFRVVAQDHEEHVLLGRSDHMEGVEPLNRLPSRQEIFLGAGEQDGSIGWLK